MGSKSGLTGLLALDDRLSVLLVFLCLHMYVNVDKITYWEPLIEVRTQHFINSCKIGYYMSWIITYVEIVE